VDTAQRILLCNPAVAGILNRSPRESRGLHLWEVLRHREIGDMVARALSDREEQTKEISLPVPEEILLRVLVRPFPREGALRGAVITFNDYTNLRRLETVRRDFVANVSHELRTPLTALRAALETLLEGALDDPKYAREFLETAENQVDRLQRLIDDLLTLSRLDKPSAADSSATADVAATVDKIVKVLSPIAKRRNVSLRAAWPDGQVLAAISADQLTQVFMNLLDNAIKFNREGGSVDISASNNNGFADIVIKDTGPGIPAEDLPRIFERFYRVEKARARELGGTGLGLAIAKHIVENSGGSITASSVLGEGSEFALRLPLSK
jgi:two-component system phosphate regulon sensor histidine kinase PhoR